MSEAAATWVGDDLRAYMVAVAYRMLGTVTEAEDVVQDALIRMASAGEREVRSPKAYAATVTARLALDELRSARARRERYVGTWLPEPVLTEPDPAERAELRDSLSAAFLVVLETLSPVERAVYVLHDLFDLPYADVAAVVDALDARAVREAVAKAEPEVVVHQLTALTGLGDFRHFDRDFAQTNRLRTEGTDILLDAARSVGARRFVAQSFGGWPYARGGHPVKTEEDPLD